MAAAIKNFFSSASSPKSSPPTTPQSAGGGASAETETQTPETQTPETPRQSAVSAYFSHLAESIVNVPPYLGRARVPQVCKWRDKEALLGEIIDLKDALEASAIHLSEHRHEYIRRLAENRKLERRVQELEQRGNYDAPRSGGVGRLEARAKGLEAQYWLLTDVVAARKHGELYELSRDLTATRTRETEVERDTYAAEIGRLKLLLQHMKSVHQQAQEQNADFYMCKKNLEKLTVLNPKVELALQDLQETIKKAKADLKAQKAKGDEAKSAVKKLEGKFSSLQSQLQGLASQMESAEKYKQERQRKLQQLGFERMKFNREMKS